MDDKTIQELCNNPELRFHKDPEAAGSYLLAVSSLLLEGKKLPMRSSITLGQALREAALLALGIKITPETDTKTDAKQKASESLLKALGLKKGGGTSLAIRAAENGDTNTDIAERFNMGKNRVPKELSLAIASEKELLENRLSHTVDVLLRLIAEENKIKKCRYVSTSVITENTRVYLRPQFRLVDEHDLEEHTQKTIEIALQENLITVKGGTIARNL